MKGFTLIEVIIAIFLLTVGTVGGFALIQRTIVFSSITASQLQATYLAQEGVEIIRNIRDTNYLEGAAWDEGIDVGSDYRLSYQSESFPDVACSNYLEKVGNFYICSSVTTSKFQRQLIVEKPEAGRMIISAIVSWQERGTSHQVNVQTELYDWR